MPPAFRGASRLRLRSGCGTVRSLVAQLVWEVRWDGPENEFTVLLDETAIADAHASIIRREEERARTGRSPVAGSAHGAFRPRRSAATDYKTRLFAGEPAASSNGKRAARGRAP